MATGAAFGTDGLPILSTCVRACVLSLDLKHLHWMVSNVVVAGDMRHVHVYNDNQYQLDVKHKH